MNDQVLQTAQFFRERVARGEAYAKHHKNGHADADKEHDDEEHEDDDQVRENPAHKNVFHRPKD